MTEVLEPHRYTTFPAEREVLAWLLQQDPGAWCGQYTAVVEIGAYEGETTEFLYKHAGWRPMTTIDPWDGTQDGSGDEVYRRFIDRMFPAMVAGATTVPGLAKPPLTVLRQRSHDVIPPANLGFVFNDGDHRDLSDVGKWWDALVPGGILAMHDVTEGAGWPECKVAMERLGLPWHEYRYQGPLTMSAEYGPSTRGLMWKIK